MEAKEMNHYAVPMGIRHHFDLDFDIEAAEQFSNFFSILREAGSEDVVYVHINCNGGCIDTTVQLINAIKNSSATIITSAEGTVASGAAVIFFSGDAFQIGDHCQFLIHTASGGGVGKISDTLSFINATTQRIQELYADVFGGFLTEQELESVGKGEELYLTSSQVKERIEAFVEQQKEEIEESE
jgi:ATP-dependent protease ClpP protease subunit